MKSLKVILVALCAACGFSTPAKPLKIVSYNVWFDRESGLHRYPRILDTLAAMDADVICLQEVTDLFMERLENHEEMSRYYVTTYETTSWYFNVTLTRKKPTSPSTVKLSGRMGRQAPIVNIRHSGNSYCVANVHLESYLEDTEIRKDQIREVLSVLNAKAVQIIAGDCNFGTGMDEEALFSEFTDSGQGSGTTFDVGVNPWAPKRSSFPSDSVRRLDRIFIKGHDADDMIYSTFGTESTGGCLSDHYGICVQLN